MHWPTKTAITLTLFTLFTLATQALAQLTFYEGEGFRGRAFSTNGAQANFQRVGFNDQASSVVVEGGRWEACEHQDFGGRCVVLGRGSYHSLQSMGLENRLSSVRRANRTGRDDEVVPPPLERPDYEYRRRPNERVYEARVSSVRAVMGPPEQRCWMEHEAGERRPANVGGALLGGVIGGVLGHQVGGGSGRDLATIGGVVAGAAIGANAGRNRGTPDREVRRCENTVNETPQYWEVGYAFRGRPHLVQMSAPPGPTVFVNRQGEPRQ